MNGYTTDCSTIISTTKITILTKTLSIFIHRIIMILNSIILFLPLLSQTKSVYKNQQCKLYFILSAYSLQLSCKYFVRKIANFIYCALHCFTLYFVLNFCDNIHTSRKCFGMFLPRGYGFEVTNQ